MKEIRKVVELFSRKEDLSTNDLVSLRVYYTDDSYETIQVKKGSKKYNQYMHYAHPDKFAEVTDDDSDDDYKNDFIKESAIPRYTSIVMILIIIAVLLFMSFREFLK